MKTLIIHNNNISNIDKYTENISFTSINDVIKTLNNKEFDIIYIKDNLSLNCLDFLGIELAYHIRFTENFKLIPIVLLSDLDGFTILKLTSKAQILLTKNTFLNQVPKNLPILDDSNYKKEFLDKIRIELPKDTSGDHDIANQWAIYKWAEFLNVDTDTIKVNKSNIENMLYFKYLKAKNPIAKKIGLSIVPKTPQSQGDILYIDDEYNKGWSDIFDKYFLKSTNINFHFLKHQYTDTDYESIETLVKEFLTSRSIDTVLLDIRLIKEDHMQKEVKELSGIKLLSFIKSFNPGIQVILLTASEKSTILDEANKHDILGYIKKENPSDGSTYTKEVFKKLTTLIDLGFDKKYLKEIWTMQEKILKLKIFNNEQHQDIKIEIKSIFELLQADMENKFIYAMFALFKTIEIIIALYIEEKKENKKRFAYWKNTNTKIKLVEKDEYFPKDLQSNSEKPNDSTLNKIRILCYEKIKLNSKDVHDSLIELVDIRNEIIHPSKTKTLEKPNEHNILRWFILVEMIVERINSTND